MSYDHDSYDVGDTGLQGMQFERGRSYYMRVIRMTCCCVAFMRSQQPLRCEKSKYRPDAKYVFRAQKVIYC